MTQSTTECFLSSWTVPTPSGEETTLPQLVARTCQENQDRILLLRRCSTDKDPMTFGQLGRTVSELAEAIVDLETEPGSRIGLLADNCAQWLITDLACLTSGCIDVPRGTDTTLDETLFILEHSGAKLAFVQGRQRFDDIRAAREKLPELKWLVLMDGEVEGAGQDGVLDWTTLIERGRLLRTRGSRRVEEVAASIAGDDVATIVYTSGTTGDPKGVMLTHRSILHNVRAIRKRLLLSRDDVFLSILPSWHMFERTLEYILLDRGSKLLYTDRRRFKKDLEQGSPTILAAVPRVWEALYSGIQAKLESAPKLRRLMASGMLASARREAQRRFGTAARALGDQRAPGLLDRGLACLDRPVARLGDRLLFQKVRAALGGRLRLGISGGGSLPEAIDLFFQSVRVPLMNGYGLTETSPIVSVRSFDQNLIGSIGRPLAETRVRIVDPEGRPLPVGQVGVLCIQGPQVMKGYYRNDTATRRVFDTEGWFSTGDLVRLTPNEDLVIVGRCKDTIVLAGGENVEPAVVESEIGSSPLIAQVLVVGQDQKQLGALVVPDPEGFKCRGIDVERAPAEHLLPGGPIGQALQQEIQRLTKRLRPFERVSKIQVMERPFSIDSGEVTPTLKLKRQVILQRHADRIESLFR
ncbi:MAG: long-chain fatty acid--CoA ligase [Planctomycetota bacterium]